MTTDPRSPQPYPENPPQNNPDLDAKPHDLGDDGEIYLGAFQDAEPDLSPDSSTRPWELVSMSQPVGPEDFGGSDYPDEAPMPLIPIKPIKADDLREYLQKPHQINAEKPHQLNRLIPTGRPVSTADHHQPQQKPQPKPAPQPAVAPRHPNPLPGITPWQESEAVKNRLYTLVEIDAMLEEVEARIELAEKEFDRLCEAVPFVRRRSGKVDHRFQGAIHKMKDLRLHFLDLAERVKKFDA